jgi:hypothetical protein
MIRCPAHGNRIQLNPSGAVNLYGATRPLNQIVVGQSTSNPMDQSRDRFSSISWLSLRLSRAVSKWLWAS